MKVAVGPGEGTGVEVGSGASVGMGVKAGVGAGVDVAVGRGAVVAVGNPEEHAATMAASDTRKQTVRHARKTDLFIGRRVFTYSRWTSTHRLPVDRIRRASRPGPPGLGDKVAPGQGGRRGFPILRGSPSQGISSSRGTLPSATALGPGIQSCDAAQGAPRPHWPTILSPCPEKGLSVAVASIASPTRWWKAPGVRPGGSLARSH